MNNPDLIDDTFINQNTDYIELIGLLEQAFSDASITVPQRHHHDFENPGEGNNTTLLLMPAWKPGEEAGVKLVTISPGNGKYDLPAIQGTYVYFEAKTGQVKAIMSAKALTAKRTAATSALASSYLSRQNARSLLMIGTGALAPNLIQAHSKVRPIEEVYIWGRNKERAQAIATELKEERFKIQVVESIEEIIEKVDIVSCATLSKTPLLKGSWIREGQHIDLVGAYKKDMRESDDQVIQKATLFVDHFKGGLSEGGDIIIPIERGIITEQDIQADLFQLGGQGRFSRSNNREITLFKSVGHALEDLTAASYYFNKFKS